MPDRLTRAVAWLQAVARSVVTWAAIIAAGATFLAGEIAAAAPDGGEHAVTWLVRLAAYAIIVVQTLRRLTPVDAPMRGVLNPPGMTVRTELVPEDGAGPVLTLGVQPQSGLMQHLRGGTYRGDPPPAA